ncbi:ATP-binding protein [Gluconobacter cerinus]|uniref:ATP-binding protein n=1 Tax=Gluconobacter cerinus TaxID=38307 RepID=UPI001B8A920A|nr:ATP-binding protein [Gluconobacter cerinus]MBS1069824.1 putative DNA binding domain-containing protein [Gluconobacter cerinus]
MSSILPIKVDYLLHLQGVESARVEFKASWDEKTTGAQCIRTICAFANDFQNLNGGYIVVGVAEQDGAAILPAKGLTNKEIEDAQIWIRGHCNTIDPLYQPVLSPEVYEGLRILVIWAPGSDARPHQAPESTEKGARRKFYIRLGSETVDSDNKPELKRQLIQMTARVPFDDRRALHASVLDIRETKVREFLNDVHSGLVDETDTKTLYRMLRIADPVNGHDAPRNVGLLFFSQDPEQWFPGARIEVVQFTADNTGDVLEEKVFSKRPIHEQLRECLSYLESLSVRMIQKLPGRTQAIHSVSYPSPALRETLVNAVYHRSYEGEPEPIKIYLFPDRMEIISYPGPVPGIEIKHLDGSVPLPPVPARNRRIGDLLKELRLAEGRGTGIPKVRRTMEQNGSPPPRFDFDEARSYFRATLPVHPEYNAILVLQDVAHLRAMGDTQGVLERLQEAYRINPVTLIFAVELAKEQISRSNIKGAEEICLEFRSRNPEVNSAPLITPIASAYLDAGSKAQAISWLDQLPLLDAVDEAFDAAIQEKRAGRLEKAHRYFRLAGDAVLRDVKALHEYAQVKIKLASKSRPRNRQSNRIAYMRLLDDAKEMLERVVQMAAPQTRHAWAWYDLGRVLRWSKAPLAETRHAFERAVQCDPQEERFSRALNEFNESHSAKDS